MISLGASVAGANCDHFVAPLLRLQRYLSEYRNGGTSSAAVHIIFHLSDGPGVPVKPASLAIDQSAAGGRRMTIRASIDAAAVRDESAVLRYLYETVDAALTLAARHFVRQSIRYDADVDRQVLIWWKRQERFSMPEDQLL